MYTTVGNIISAKIALLHDGGPVSGISTYFYNVFDNLKTHNVNCEFYQYFRWKPEMGIRKDIMIVSGSRTDTIPKIQLSRKIDTALNLVSGSNWKHFRKRVDGDIIILSNPSLLKLIDYYRNTIPIAHDLYYLHQNVDSALLNRYFRKQYNLFLKAKLVIANSVHTKSELVQLLGVEADIISVVYPYFDSKIFYSEKKGFSQMDKNKDEKFILSVGSDQPNKNIENIILALKELPDNYKLIRVGKTTFTSKLIEQLGLSSRVIHYQNIKPEKLAELYRYSDIFLFPSLHEGFGIPLVEAMACGTPVITSDRGSLPEVVGNAGIMIDPLNPSMIADKVQKITSDEKFRNSLTANGFKRVKVFTIENQFLAISSVLEKALIIQS